MRISTFVLSLVLCFGLVSDQAAADQHGGAGPAAMQVFMLGPGDGGVAQLIPLLERGRAIAEQIGSGGKGRYFQVAFGGPTSGSVVVAIEFPSLVALAESETKMNANPDYQKLIADIQAAGVRVLSRAVTIELGQ